jgi:hypothetical protein
LVNRSHSFGNQAEGNLAIFSGEVFG